MIKTYISSFQITRSINGVRQPYIFIGIDKDKRKDFIDKYGDFTDDARKNTLHKLPEHPTLGFTSPGEFTDPLYFYNGSMILRLDNEFHLPLARILNNFEYGDLNISIICNVAGEQKLWTGFIEPVTGGTNVDDFPYEIQLDYHDGLGKLGEEDFVLTFDDQVYNVWDGYWGDEENDFQNGYAIPITQVFDYCCRIAGIDLNNIYYKQAIIADLDKFIYKDTGKEFYNNLNTICVPKGFLMDGDTYKNSLNIMNDILLGLGLQGFMFGGSLILFPIVDNNPNEKFVRLTKSSGSLPITFFGTARRSSFNTFRVAEIEDDDLVDWIPHREKQIGFNTDNSSISYIEKGDVFTSRSVNADRIIDSLKSEKDAVKAGSSSAHFNVFGTLLGRGLNTTRSKSPNIKDKKIDGFRIESTRSLDYDANHLERENYIGRRYIFTIPKPVNLIDKNNANDVFSFKFTARGVLGYMQRDISNIGMEIPFVMLRFDLIIGAKTIIRFATVATDNDGEQESSVDFKINEFEDADTPLRQFETARLVVTLCETMPTNPYFIDSLTSKLVLEHTEVQPSLVLSEASSGNIYAPKSNIFRISRGEYLFGWDNGSVMNLPVQDGSEAPNKLTIDKGDVDNNLSNWSLNGGLYGLLQDLALMDSKHSPFGNEAGFKRYLNVLGRMEADPSPVQMISNGLRFRFAPSYIRDRTTYQVAAWNTAFEVGGVAIDEEGASVSDVGNFRAVGSDVAGCDFWLDGRYYANLTAGERRTLISFTSNSRSSEAPQSIDVDILKTLFNQDGKVKLGYLGEEDFDLVKNFNGGAFICFEVEPIVKELSLTWKGQAAFQRRVGSSIYQRYFKILTDKLYDSSRNRYTTLEDAVGYSVIGTNLNQDAKIKMNFITVTNGEARVTSFDMPIVRLKNNSQYYRSLVDYYIANTDFGGTESLRERAGQSLATQPQTLGRGNNADLLPFYYNINNMREWLTLPSTDLLAKKLIQDQDVSEFYYVLKEITIGLGDILFVVQEEGNSLLTQVKEWQGITETYGDEKAIHSYDIVMGTLHDSWSRFKISGNTISDPADARFPLSELMTSNYFLFYNWSGSSISSAILDKIENQRAFDSDLYSFHGNIYRTHRLNTLRYKTPTEALNSIYNDYHSKKRIIVTGDAVGLEEDEVLTPLQYVPFRWKNRLEEVGSDDTRLLRPTEFSMSFGDGIRSTLTATENIRTSELDASLLFKSFGPSYDDSYN